MGFASDGGAIFSRPVKDEEERVIENKGNADWRTRGRPAKGASQPQHHDEVEIAAGIVVEKEEASKKAGRQFAEKNATTNGQLSQNGPADSTTPEEMPQTADEAALSALLNGSKDKSSSTTTTTTTTITIQESQSFASPTTTGDETLDFRTDVASRPNPSTLDEYAAMPVEEFGMALLRGMGKKRRANGEVIVIKNPNEEPDEEEKKRDRERKKLRDPNKGYLGIGAKPVKIGNGAGGVGGSGEDGLGAWGKSDMRRNKKGEGLYTPVMLRDRRTGELISERELEERKKLAKEAMAGKRDVKSEEDWRERRDRNLDRNGIGAGEGRNAKQSNREDDHDHREKQLNGSPRRKMIQDASSTRDALRHSISSSTMTTTTTTTTTRSRSRSRSGERCDRHRDREGDVHWKAERSRDRRRDRQRHDDSNKNGNDNGRYDSASSSSRRNGHHRDRYDDRGSR